MSARYRTEKVAAKCINKGVRPVVQRKELGKKNDRRVDPAQFDNFQTKRPKWIWAYLSARLRLAVVFFSFAAFSSMAYILSMKRRKQLDTMEPQFPAETKNLGQSKDVLPGRLISENPQKSMISFEGNIEEEWVPVEPPKPRESEYCSTKATTGRNIYLDLNAGYGTTLRLWKDLKRMRAPAPPCAPTWEVFGFEGNRLVAPRTSNLVQFLNGRGGKPKFSCFPLSRDANELRAYEMAYGCAGTSHLGMQSSNGQIEEEGEGTGGKQTSCLASKVSHYVHSSARRNRLMQNSLNTKWNETLENASMSIRENTTRGAVYRLIPADPAPPSSSNETEVKTVGIWDGMKWPHWPYGRERTKAESFQMPRNTVDIDRWLEASFSTVDYIAARIAVDLDEDEMGEQLLEHYTESETVARLIDFVILDCVSKDREKCRKIHDIFARQGVATISREADNLFGTEKNAENQISIDSASIQSPISIAGNIMLECGFDSAVPCVPPPSGYVVKDETTCGEVVPEPIPSPDGRHTRKRAHIYKYENAPFYTWPLLESKAGKAFSQPKAVLGGLTEMQSRELAISQKGFIEKHYVPNASKRLSVLEIGCGSGNFIALFKVNEGSKLICVESGSSAQMDANRQSLDGGANQVSRFDDVKHLEETRDGATVRAVFDLVMSSHVLQHFGCSLLHIMAKHMKKNGMMFIEVPKTTEEDIQNARKGDVQATYWTQNSLEAVLHQAGLEVVALDTLEHENRNAVLRCMARTIVK